MIQIKQCNKNPHHWYSGHASQCPWCAIQLRTRTDHFPQDLPDRKDLKRPPEQEVTPPPGIPQPSPSYQTSRPVLRPAGSTPRIAGVLFIIVICIIGGWILLSSAHTNSLLGVPIQTVTETPTPNPVENIHLNPIEDRYIGEKFTISATTPLPPGEKVIFEIYPASSGQLSKNTYFSGDAGVAVVTQGDSPGQNIITFDVDSSTLAPKEYTLRATSMNQTVWGASRLTIHDGLRPATSRISYTKVSSSGSSPKQTYPVTITAKGSGNYYYQGETVHLSGSNTDSDVTYLFILGPNLPMNGAQFGMDLKNYPVKNNDPLTFTRVPVNTNDRTWSYDWNMNNVTMGGVGIYTIYAVSAPRDRTHLSGISCSAVPVIIQKPFISAVIAHVVVKKGESIIISGTAEGNPSSVAAWIFGNGYVTRTIGSVNPDSSFRIIIPGATTKNMPAGDYVYVVQHPMENNQFDIDYNANTGQVYNVRTGNVIFNASGQNSPDGSAAGTALINSINDDLTVDDFITKGQFIIEG
jgi:hypothetical protein